MSTILKSKTVPYGILLKLFRRNYSSAVLAPAKSHNEKDPNKFSGVVLGIYERNSHVEQPKLTNAARSFDKKANGQLSKLIRDFNLTGESGRAKLLHNTDSEFDAVAVVGLGPDPLTHKEMEIIDQRMENVRIAAALGCDKLQGQNCDVIHVDAMDYAEPAAEGSTLAVWRYQENVQEHKKTKVPKLELYQSEEGDSQEWMSGVIRAEAQNMAR